MPRDTDPQHSIYSALLDTATDPLWVLNSDEDLEFVNQEFAELTGYDAVELQGHSPDQLFVEGGETWTHYIQFVRESDPGETAEWASEICSKMGAEIPVEIHCRAIEIDGRTVVVGRFHDLREKRQEERKLNVLNRVLRHNIRNEINIILGKASLLQEIDDEGYRTAAEKIEEIGHEVNNISDKARRAQQHINVPLDEDASFDLVEQTEQAVRSFEITQPTATVRTNLPGRAPARASPSFDVALQELLENAVVHNPAENAPIEIEIEIDDEESHVHVKDECEPIPEGVTETIGRGTEQPLHHNDGIGLWIVQWIVDSVGGELSFDRRPEDSGNVVTVSFETLTPADLEGPGANQPVESGTEIR